MSPLCSLPSGGGIIGWRYPTYLLWYSILVSMVEGGASASLLSFRILYKGPESLLNKSPGFFFFFSGLMGQQDSSQSLHSLFGDPY